MHRWGRWGLVLGSLLGAQEPQSPGFQETWSLHGQITSVLQGHGGFRSPYSGDQSLEPRREARASFSATVFVGRRLWEGGELYFDPEFVGGQAPSRGFGLGGGANGEGFRLPEAGTALYISQLFLRQTWHFAGEIEDVESGPNQLAGRRSRRRLVLTAGRFFWGDLFDENAYAHDPRTQFLNWALMDTATWDYPADTRGLALAVHWDDWALRAGSFLVTREAHGEGFDPALSRARGDVLEVEHAQAWGDRDGSIRLMAFTNRADMGEYRASLDLSPMAPDITQTRRPGRIKRGWGLSVDQALGEAWGAFIRWGWNDGRTETWAFTEVDRTAALGAVWEGRAWAGRPARMGVALVVNGLSPDHRDYLAAGGTGVLLGDGRLKYGDERILEAYAVSEIRKGLEWGLDLQQVWHPGYNRDWGPVTLYGLRLHVHF